MMVSYQTKVGFTDNMRDESYGVVGQKALISNVKYFFIKRLIISKKLSPPLTF